MSPLFPTTPPTGRFRQLTIDEETNTTEAPSPNSMVVDAPEEHIVEPNGTENDDVAIINPDTMDTDVILASDCQSGHPSYHLASLTIPQMRQ